LTGIFRIFERDEWNAGFLEHVLQHGPIEQSRIAEARRREDDAFRGGSLDGTDQMLALLLLVGFILGCGGLRMVEKSRGKAAQRFAFCGHVAGQPARDQKKIVVHHIAARQLERFDEIERRLLAKRAG